MVHETTTRARGACHPTGVQYEIRHGNQSAVVAELGATLRAYECGGTRVLDGFAADEPARGGRGAVLVPWPNRIEDGRYPFEGTVHQLPIDDVVDGHAIHGLVRWVPWRVIRRRHASVALGTTVFPRPGYPFTLAARVTYWLSDVGLSVSTIVRNAGGQAAPVGIGHHPYLAVPGERIDGAMLHLVAAARYPTGARRLPDPYERLTGGPHDFRDPKPIGDTVLSATYGGLERDAAGRAWVRLGRTRLWMEPAYEYVLLFSGEDLPNPLDHRRSLAVEPMTCPPNAFRTGVGLRALEPGGIIRARWGIVHDSLSAAESAARR